MAQTLQAVQAVQTDLAALVCKTGVALGGLAPPLRALALALPALSLAEGVQASEPEVNELLKAELAGNASFLATDHVELRRWLVDTGWWRRDGFGHAYERMPAALLPPALAAVLGALRPLDLTAWVARQRQAQQQLREARRQAWARQTGQGAGAAAGEEPND